MNAQINRTRLLAGSAVALVLLAACGADRVAANIGSLCTANDQCPTDGYCNTSAGSPGKCETKPQACDASYVPVCGTDGKTYSNACAAATAGVSVKHKGECGAPNGCVGPGGKSYAIGDKFPAPDGCNTCECTKEGPACTELACAPGSCTSNSQCSATHYCAKKTCGDVGLCAARPQACPDNVDPVCGCDDKTYSNACEAAQAGAAVAYTGSCATTGACKDNAACGTGKYCAKTSCAAATGQCKQRPQACIDLWAPVCGCDDKTYSNDCDAAAAGTNVAAKGECKSSGCIDDNGKHYQVGDTFAAADGCNTCTCTVNGIACSKKACTPPSCSADSDCTAKNSFCQFAPNKCSGTGSCSVRPDACIEIYSPVCGCDGKTYSNSCFAAGAGTSVASIGVCAP